MKKNYLYYLLVVMLLVASCEKDPLAEATDIETQEITSIAATTAIGGGHISSDGRPTIKECGVEWCSTNDFKSEIFNCAAEKAKVGDFTCEITDLNDATTYYVRSYAKNNYGTIYGPIVSFTTLESVLPTVTTSAITDITAISATVGGEVTSDGNVIDTERGIVYSTNQNPTIDDSKVSSGNGLGAFTCQLTGLQDGVTYYVRAYAVNSKGVAYGEEKSFTTKVIVLPTVTTSAVTDITAISATVGGEVTADGNAEVTERGVVYSTNQNPTIDDSKVSSGNGLGAFTCQLTGLQDGVTYYVRAYALNSKGIAYGEEMSFTTKLIVLPTVTTSAVMDITAISATVGGEVTADGNAEVTERGVVYATNQNPTIDDSKVSSGNGLGAFVCQLTGLQVGVTYYVRAYAVNQKGIAYGEEVTCTIKYKYFSVSSSKQIVFSPGNLQYHPANKKWRFAPSQIDYIGEANSNISTSYNGWVDLFGWGTGANPTNISTNDNNYQTFVDWGTNQIGSDAPNTWRTLTAVEWRYLSEYRNNASSLKGIARVNGVNGLILLPDNWTCPSGVTFKSGFHRDWSVEAYGQYQTFSADQWSKLEAAGAVFLPAAGCRYNGSNIENVQFNGGYWSATGSSDLDEAYRFVFESDGTYMWVINRYYGFSVRLVKDL